MNFDKIGKKLGLKVQSTVSEVQKMNEIRQLNNRIGDEKKQIQSVYSEMGKKLFQQFRDCPPEGFGVLFEEITECEEAIADYEQQIRDIRKVRICPNCHAEIPLDGKFCSACGTELPSAQPAGYPDDIFEEEEPEPVKMADEAADTAASEAQELAEEAVETVQAAAEKAVEPVQAAAEEVGETVQAAMDEAGEIVREVKESVTENTEA